MQHPNFIQSYFHGTKADLQSGKPIVPGHPANYGARIARYVYVTSNLNVAIWAAELAQGKNPSRIFVVEPIGTIENDPNLKDKKFPGNPTNSLRSNQGFIVVAEVVGWMRHSEEEVREAREKVEAALKMGAPILEKEPGDGGNGV